MKKFLIITLLFITAFAPQAQARTLNEVILATLPPSQENSVQFVSQIDSVLTEIRWLPDRQVPGVDKSGTLAVKFPTPSLTPTTFEPMIEIASDHSTSPHLRFIFKDLKMRLLPEETNYSILYTNHVFYTYLHDHQTPVRLLKSSTVDSIFSSGLYLIQAEGKAPTWVVLQTIASSDSTHSLLSIYYNEKDALKQYDKPMESISVL